MMQTVNDVTEALEKAGVDFRVISGHDDELESCTVMCVAGDIAGTVAELNKSPRDQVVMVRLDADTKADLEAWVETGAVKSMSEAAALFIREGIRVRSQELDELKAALEDVRKAKQRLEERARKVIGGDVPSD